MNKNSRHQSSGHPGSSSSLLNGLENGLDGLRASPRNGLHHNGLEENGDEDDTDYEDEDSKHPLLGSESTPQHESILGSDMASLSSFTSSSYHRVPTIIQKASVNATHITATPASRRSPSLVTLDDDHPPPATPSSPVRTHALKKSNGHAVSGDSSNAGPTSNGKVVIDIPESGPSSVRVSDEELLAEEESRPLRRKDRYPDEWLKTLLSFVFFVCCAFTTGIALAVVHEQMPEYAPLPDQVLDRIFYQKWALFGSEYLIQVQSAVAVAVILFHKHRSIVLRRVLLIVGVLYFYRAVTMWVTALPKADVNYPCKPKVNGTVGFGEVMKRATSILLGAGLSLNGKHVFCGDYIYSGHTMTLVLFHHVVKEYTPRRFYILHWLTWLIAVSAVILLLLSRGHYTVDVIIAYFVTTRLWSTYHTIAGHHALKQISTANHFSRYWWFDGIRWFEANVKAGKLPNEYNWPIPARCLKALCLRCRKCLRRRPQLNRAEGLMSSTKSKKGVS